MIALLLADGFEEVEAITPIDILRRGDVKVVTYSITNDLCVCGGHNIMTDADDCLSNANFEKIDGVILPGGLGGTENLWKNEEVQSLLEQMNEEGKLICAICAAPSILGKKGYLDGKKFTCYPGFEKYAESGIYTGENVVCDGNIITSKGMGTAMDFALAILAHIKDEETAKKVAESVMYR